MPDIDLSDSSETNDFHQSVNIPTIFYKDLTLFRCINMRKNIWQDFMQFTEILDIFQNR